MVTSHLWDLIFSFLIFFQLHEHVFCSKFLFTALVQIKYLTKTYQPHCLVRKALPLHAGTVTYLEGGMWSSIHFQRWILREKNIYILVSNSLRQKHNLWLQLLQTLSKLQPSFSLWLLHLWQRGVKSTEQGAQKALATCPAVLGRTFSGCRALCGDGLSGMAGMPTAGAATGNAGKLAAVNIAE